MSSDAEGNKPWERRPSESAQAYGAFRAYCGLGSERTFVAAAEAVGGKNPSLLRRWAARHNWKERVHAWDIAQARDDEAALREERDEALRNLAREADRLRRIGMAGLSRLVIRDPVTGAAALDPAVTVGEACRICELSLKIFLSLPSPSGPADGGGSAASDISRLSDQELREIIELARQRAQGSKEEPPDASE